ncbi:MAG: hypothetical protein P8076_04365 [Gammaproteobacteria bacterium]
MDRSATEPLTTDEAKARLKKAAGEIGVSAWVRRQPLQALSAALLAGVFLGSQSGEKRAAVAAALWTRLFGR